MRPGIRAALVLLAALALGAGLLVSGCGDDRTITGPNDDAARSAIRLDGRLLDLEHEVVQNAVEIQEMHSPDLMERPGVVGTAVGVNDGGEVVVKVYLESEDALAEVPLELDGLPVQAVVTGRLVARGGNGMGGMMGGGTNPQSPQAPPIELGTSGGWRYDLANGYCCGGTLGALVENGSGQFILSNYHVLYADIVSGGNNRVASAGDPVIQPALIDVNCNANGSIDVATLVNGGGSLPGANVDAGIAAVIPGQVNSTGEILDIGVPSSSTTGAFLGQDLKKMGRTTGLGRGTVDGLNATVSITYENECAGGTAFTKTFTGQIVITNARCKFLDGGDSGAVAFEDVTSNPRAVGLLFAGSFICNRSAVAIANPIDDVLGHYGGGMSMVGN